MAVTYTTIPELQGTDEVGGQDYFIVQTASGTMKVAKDILFADTDNDIFLMRNIVAQMQEQIDSLSNDNHIVEEVLGATTGKSQRVNDGEINYRKWSDGTLEIWGYGRQYNIGFASENAFLGGYKGKNSGVNGSGSDYYNEERFTVWGSYPVPFIKIPAVNIWLSGYDYETSSVKELLIVNTYRDINTDAKRNNLTYVPTIEVVAPNTGTMGHPVFSFDMIGKWK